MQLDSIVVALASLGLVVGGAASVLPPEYSVERTVRVEAPPTAVYAVVAKLETRPRWSAWFVRDPSAQTAFAGTPGAVGSTMRWNGDKIGRGTVAITALEDARSVTTRLELLAPMASVSADTFVLEPDGAGTRVRWRNTGRLSGVNRMFGPFIDRVLGPDYEQGLERLKKLVESGT